MTISLTDSFSIARLCHSPIPRHAAVLLVALAWSNFAFCGEIHDAAEKGDLEKVRGLLKDNPALVFSKDREGRTPLILAVDYRHFGFHSTSRNTRRWWPCC